MKKTVVYCDLCDNELSELKDEFNNSPKFITYKSKRVSVRITISLESTDGAMNKMPIQAVDCCYPCAKRLAAEATTASDMQEAPESRD